MVVVAEVAIEKCFTSAYRALEEEADGLRIYIYSGNDGIKVGCLIRI